MDYSSDKEKHFQDNANYYISEMDGIKRIPGCPIAYWVSERFKDNFVNYESLGEFVECAAGISTGDNDYYLKLWHEVDNNLIAKSITSEDEFVKSNYSYAYCNKGGTARKWYGNNDYVAWWKKSEEFHRNGATYKHLMFKPGITWSEICMGNFSRDVLKNE